MAGIEAAVNLVADDVTSSDGTVDVVLKPEGTEVSAAGAQVVELPAGATSLVVRQFFYDWEHEEPADLDLVVVSAPREVEAPRSSPSAKSALAGGVGEVGDFVLANLGSWRDMEAQLLTKVRNGFQPPAARTDIGGAAENVTVWDAWALADDEALVSSCTRPFP